MLDYLYVYIRRLKWDIQYYIRYMWRDIVICILFIVMGISMGIAVTIESELIKQCIIYRLIEGTYSPLGTFIKVMLYIIVTLCIISITGFLKIYRFIHYIIIFYWGYRFGVDIIAITSIFTGFISLIFIYIPFYLFSICIFVSHIMYIRLTVPSPRPNWWCYSKCLMSNLIRRGLYLMIPSVFINICIFIINPIIIQIFTIVI